MRVMRVALAVAIVVMALLYFFVEDKVLQKIFLCVAVGGSVVTFVDRFVPRPENVIRETEQQADPGGDDKAAKETAPAVGSSTPPGSGDVTDELVAKFLRNCKFGGLECLYALQKACDNKEPLSSKQIIKYMGERFYGFFYGFVVAARSIELVKFTASRGRWTVTWIHPRIDDRLKDAIRRRLGRKRAGPFKKLNDMLGVEWPEYPAE